MCVAPWRRNMSHWSAEASNSHGALPLKRIGQRGHRRRLSRHGRAAGMYLPVLALFPALIVLVALVSYHRGRCSTSSRDSRIVRTPAARPSAKTTASFTPSIPRWPCAARSPRARPVIAQPEHSPRLVDGSSASRPSSGARTEKARVTEFAGPGCESSKLISDRAVDPIAATVSGWRFGSLGPALQALACDGFTPSVPTTAWQCCSTPSSSRCRDQQQLLSTALGRDV